MNFGHAIEIIRAGGYVTRDEWEPGTWIGITRQSHIEADSREWRGASALAAKQQPVNAPNGERFLHVRAHIDQRQSHGALVVGWVPTQDDMLADDWLFVAGGGGVTDLGAGRYEIEGVGKFGQTAPAE